MPRKSKKDDQKVTKATVKKMINAKLDQAVEDKHHDYSVSNQSMTTTAVIQDALAIPQQTTAGTGVVHVGNNIKIKRIRMKYNISAGALQAFTVNARVLLIQWLDDSVPAASDIFFSTAANIQPVSWYLFDANRKNQPLKILYDRTHSVSILAGGPAGHNVTKEIKGFIKNINFQQGNSGTPSYGDIYFVYLSDVASNAPSVSAHIETVFEDA